MEGLTCSHCRPHHFHLSASNPDGCLPCFCMGVTQQCASSSYTRHLVRAYTCPSTGASRKPGPMVSPLPKGTPFSVPSLLPVETQIPTLTYNLLPPVTPLLLMSALNPTTPLLPPNVFLTPPLFLSQP